MKKLKKEIYIFIRILICSTVFILLCNFNTVSAQGIIEKITDNLDVEPKEMVTEQIILTPSMPDSSTGIGVSWYSNTSSTASKLRISENSNMFNYIEFTGNNATATAATGKLSHKVSATDLKPNTKYYYQVGDGNLNNWSSIYSFTTGVKAGGDFTFIFVSDQQPKNQNDANTWENTLAQAMRKVPHASMVLSAGDQVDDYTGDDILQETQYTYFTQPEDLRNIALVPANGNHDNNRIAFFNHFNLPGKPSGVGAGGVEGSIYSFTMGDALFMVMNTNADLNSQITWLKSIANNSIARWKIVMMHKSLYAVANHLNDAVNDGSRNLLYPVFDELGIDLVLAGHDHSYIRTYPMKNNIRVNENIVDGYSQNPEGTIYLQTNGAANKQYDLVTNTPEYYTAKKLSGSLTGPRILYN